MKKNRKIFIIFSFLLMSFQILELILKFFHTSTSICSSEGCRLAERSVRYGDWLFLTTGILVTLLLIILTLFEKDFEKEKEFVEKSERNNSDERDNNEKEKDGSRGDRLITIFINSILILVLAVEGFLVGFQVFQLHHLCSFCLTIFCGFVFLTLIRLFAGHKEILTGFACYICVFTAVSLVKPPVDYYKCKLPENKKFILFYSPGCSHCERIIKECKKCKIEVCKIPAEKKYLNFLQELGIREVPVLVINKKNKKEFLIGESEIKKYIYSLVNNKSSFLHDDQYFNNQFDNQPDNQYFQHLKPFPSQKGPEDGGSCRIGESCGNSL